MSQSHPASGAAGQQPAEVTDYEHRTDQDAAASSIGGGVIDPGDKITPHKLSQIDEEAKVVEEEF